MTDIREAAEALLAAEIYDVEQKIYSDLHLVGMVRSQKYRPST